MAVVSAGAAIGVATGLIALHGAGQVDPYWTVAIEHLSTACSAGAIAVFVVRRRETAKLIPARGRLRALAAIAVTGTGGDVAYTLASRGGALSVVSAISSLYPLATVTLGVAVAHRRATWRQALGIGLALAGAALLGVGAR